MTKATMALTELAEKGPEEGVLRQKIQFVAQRLMRAPGGQIGCASRGVGAAYRAFIARCASSIAAVR